MTQDNVVDITINQPLPKFNLNDLEQTLTTIYNNNLSATKQLVEDKHGAPNAMFTNNGMLQELMSKVSQIKSDLDSISLPLDTNKTIEEIIKTEKPEFYVCGVQSVEYGKIVGTSLYTNIIKARTIRDVLKNKFIELRVTKDFDAKIVNYPVY